MWLPPRFARSTAAQRLPLLLLALAMLVALPGCGLKDLVVADNPPETAEDIVGYAESRIGAVARATTRASQAGSLSFRELLDIREQIAEAREITAEARKLLAAGQPGEAVSTVDRAEAILNVLQRRLREVQPDG